MNNEERKFKNHAKKIIDEINAEESKKTGLTFRIGTDVDTPPFKRPRKQYVNRVVQPFNTK